METVRGVAVVIVTYNGARWISDCLASVLNSHVTCTIIVVDNCSTDDTVQLITNSFPDVLLIQNKRNEGFGQANNVGILHAMRMNVDYVFLLNQDTTIHPDTIGLLVESFTRNSRRFAIISPMQLNDDGTGLDEGFHRFLSKSLSDTEIDKLITGSDETTEVGFVNAAAWMIPTTVFRNVGGFAPLFFHYGEDRDFVSRIKFHGYHVGVRPNSRIQHYRSDRRPVAEWPFERKVKYYYVNWLSRAADIQTGLLSAFFLGLTWVCKESLFYLIRGTPSVAAASMFALWRMLRALPDVVRHRTIVKHRGRAHFLDVGDTEKSI
jgi:GT2 family glycosyltransferase